MSASEWLSLALICILGAASPGPSLAVVLAVSRLHGRKGGCVAAIGHGLGVFFYALIAAASLSYILKQHANLFQAVQIAGALMLVWIGGRLLTATRRRAHDHRQPRLRARRHRARHNVRRCPARLPSQPSPAARRCSAALPLAPPTSLG